MPRKKGKKGYKATRRLSQRDKDKRGGNAAQALPGGEAGTLARLAESYLENLAVRNYTPDTIEGRRDALKVFLLWAVERELLHPSEIPKPILESYQRHLWRWRKANGKPLGISTQRSRLGTLKDFFAHLVKSNHLPANPASELEMPRPEKRLPQDGRINVRIKGEEIDIRVSTVPTVWGESVSLRLLTRGKIFFGLDRLGFDGRTGELCQQASCCCVVNVLGLRLGDRS
jgi:hypothetical protein